MKRHSLSLLFLLLISLHLLEMKRRRSNSAETLNVPHVQSKRPVLFLSAYTMHSLWWSALIANIFKQFFVIQAPSAITTSPLCHFVFTFLLLSPIPIEFPVVFQLYNSYYSQRRASSLAVSALVDLERDVTLRVRNVRQTLTWKRRRSDSGGTVQSKRSVQSFSPY